MSTLDSFIKQWSKTPSANGTTPNVVPYGWPENQAPSSVNNCARQNMADHRYQWEDAEWFCRGETVSKASATSFKITTDVTAIYLADRRIKIFDTTTMYATVLTSSYSAPDTTITLQFDNSENSLGASFSAVALSILSPINTAIPRSTATSNKGKNLIIGGNFDTNPWQRGTTFTTMVNGAYAADQWLYFQLVSGGAVDIKKTADAPTVAQAGMFVQNCLHVDVTTADASIGAGDLIVLGQYIEGYNFRYIAQKYFTISFWVKSTKTGIFCVSFRNSVADRSYVAEYTVNASNTWEYKTITVSASPTAGTWNYTTGIGIGVFFAIACGSTYQTTAGAWQTGDYLGTANQVNGMDSNTNDFKIALVQVEAGTVASPFEIENVQEVIANCQRYYHRITGAVFVGTGFVFSTSHSYNLIQFPVMMRATPTMAVSSAGDFNILYAATNVAATAVTLNTGYVDNAMLDVTVTGTPLTVGQGTMMSGAGAGAYIEFISVIT